MKPWLTVAEAAVLIGRHKSRIYRWIEANRVITRENVDGVIEVSTVSVRDAETKARPGRRRGDTPPDR